MSVPWTTRGAALLGWFQIGVAVVILNTMLEAVSKDLGFEKSIGGAVASATLFLGTGVGNLVARSFEKLRVEYEQLCISLLFAAGNTLCGASIDYKLSWGGLLGECVPVMILAGRFVSGLATGCIVANSPRDFEAASPVQIGGNVDIYSQVSVALGAFLGLLIGVPLELESFDIGYEWWRVMFFIAVAPAAVQYFLSLDAIASFRKSSVVSKENVNPAQSNQPDKLERAEEGNPLQDQASYKEDIQSNVAASCSSLQAAQDQIAEKQNWREALNLCFEPHYRRFVILGIGVPVVCQLSGITIIASYSTIIFQHAGVQQSIMGSILSGAVSLTTGSISAVACHRFNRKTLVNASFSGIGFSYLGLALSSGLTKSNVSGLLSVIFVGTFIVSFTIGCGFISVTYAPEVVPPEVAGVILGTGQAMSIFSSLLLVLVFPSVLEAFGSLLSFGILSLASFVVLVFLNVFMIETKRRDLKTAFNEIKATPGGVDASQ